MKDWQDVVWQLLFGMIIVFLGGWIVGSLVNFTAMLSPGIESKVLCPQGSYITQGSTTTTTLTCYDANNAPVPPLSTAESVALQRKYFYLPSNILMIILVIGWIIWQRRKNQAKV